MVGIFFEKFMTRKLLGVKVDDVSEMEVLATVGRWLEEYELRKDRPLEKDDPFIKSRIIATVGPEFLLTAQKDEEFRTILNSADLVIPEGFGLRLYGGVNNRVPGIELMLDLCRQAAEKKWSVGLVGGAEGMARTTASKLSKMYPSINISISADGQEANKILEQVKLPTKADLLFVAFGHPKQEKFLWNCKLNIAHCSFRVGMGVGGAFDYISGRRPMAPGWVMKIGLEWLWRLITQMNRPNHIKRILNATIVFPWELLKKKVGIAS